MASRLEFDLRWATLFCSFIVSYLLREHPIALTIYLVLFSLLIVGYLLVLPRYLDTVEARLRAQLLTHLEDDKIAEATQLVATQRILRSLGRRYVTDNALGIITLSRGDYDEAHRHFHSALTQAPYGERMSIELNLANVEVALDRSDLAIDRCRSLLTRYPHAILVRERMARLMLEEMDD
jgi:tetratricopeptide (TPR) repeat protein